MESPFPNSFKKERPLLVKVIRAIEHLPVTDKFWSWPIILCV